MCFPIYDVSGDRKGEGEKKVGVGGEPKGQRTALEVSTCFPHILHEAGTLLCLAGLQAAGYSLSAPPFSPQGLLNYRYTGMCLSLCGFWRFELRSSGLCREFPYPLSHLLGPKYFLCFYHPVYH